MKNINITLPICFDSDKTAQLNALGVNTSISDTDTKNVTFYSIDVISPYEEEGKNYTEIISSGLSFICTYSYDEMWNKLNMLRNESTSR